MNSSVSGWDRSGDGMRVFFFVFSLTVTLCALSDQSVTYRTLAYWCSVLLLVHLVLNSIFMVSYFATLTLLSLTSRFWCLCPSLLPTTWRRFFPALLTLAWWDDLFAACESLDMLSEDEMFLVSQVYA